MARCATCNTFILFGGKTDGANRYCNENCLAAGELRQAGDLVPAELLARQVEAVHQGSCPVCGGEGPVDVHVSHRVWSVVLLTSWNSRARVSCRGCGRKAKLGDAAFCLLFGWWGLPWGLLMTPVQVVRNVGGLFGGSKQEGASPELANFVRMDLAERVMRARRLGAEREAGG